jgi:ferritin-like protein
MTTQNAPLHEIDLSEETVDLHRAISSLMEELEAVDWYQQRAERASSIELKQIIQHNRDEEIEHAAMLIEWLRRAHPVFEENLRTYLFTDGPIVANTHRAQDDSETMLSIGSLREVVMKGVTTNESSA